MINSYNLSETSSAMHMVSVDPGRLWHKDQSVIMDVSLTIIIICLLELYF